jgi:hypothetical protein
MMDTGSKARYDSKSPYDVTLAEQQQAKVIGARIVRTLLQRN